MTFVALERDDGTEAVRSNSFLAVSVPVSAVGCPATTAALITYYNHFNLSDLLSLLLV